MTAKIGWASAVFAGIFLLMGLSAQADHFSFKRLTVNGQERATIYSHGMDLFEITTSAGGYTPVQRAQVIVERLEKLADSHDFDAVRFSVGFRNGEVILQQDDHDHESHLILTIDRRLGQRAGVSAERLALWYIALLWDHLRLANGRRPTSTKGTQVGVSFQKIHTRLGASEGHVASEKIERALTALSEDEEEAFCKAACAVPPSFHPERLQAERKSSKGQSSANEMDTHSPNETPKVTRRALQRKPPADPEDEHEHTRESKSETPNDTRPDGGKPLSKTAGRYRITLYPAIAAMKIGEKTDFQVEIAEEANREKRLANATVRVRLTRKEANPAPSILASFDTQTETYRFRITFDHAGDYGIALGVLSDEGEAFTASFTFSVQSPEQWDFSGEAQRSGNHRVRLAFLPSRAVAGKQVEFALKITEVKSTETPVIGATVRCWFAADRQDYSEVAWYPARAGEEPGVYRWRLVVPKVGSYRVVVRIATNEKRFNVEFPVAVTEEITGEASKKQE